MKKRITHIKHGNNEIPVNAEEDWEEFLATGSPAQVIEISPFHFQVHLPWIDLPDTIKTRFFDHFSDPKAISARKVATMGLAHKNYEQEFDLAQEASSFHDDLNAGKYKGKKDRMLSRALSIALQFSEITASRDPAPFRRLAAIIDDGGIPQSDSPRGGDSSEDGYMMEKFVELHAASYSLPTKKQLRVACGLNGLEYKKLADKRMKKLGLWGLPTELEI